MDLLERMKRITDTIMQTELVYANEYDLQAAIARALEQGGHLATREVRLDSGNRLDILVYAAEWAGPRVAIEVKVDGSRLDVIRQLHRYASEVAVDAILLVTTRTRHNRLPEHIHGKPVQLVTLLGAAL